MYFSGWEEFFLQRRRKYQSNIFRTNMFRKMIVALDHQAIAYLFESDHLIQDYGFGWAAPPRGLVGYVTPSIFETGPKHDRPKAFYMRLLRMRAVTLIPVFNDLAAEFIARWLSLKQFSWRDELEDFSASCVFQWLLGERPDPKDIRLLYLNIFTQFFVGVTKHLPWSNYSRSLVAYDRLVKFIKNAKTFPEILAMARDEGLTDEDAVAKQIAFLLGMNSFLGIQALLKALVGELSLRPELCASLREEISVGLSPSNNLQDFAALDAMPMLDKTLRETLRLHPPVTFIFGRATQNMTIESASGMFSLSEGELMMGVIAIAHKNESIFPHPDRFDPNRFDDPIASQHLIWPRGLQDAQASSHDRTCPGKDAAILIGKLFCISVLSTAEWELETPPEWERQKFVPNVAAPKGAMEVKTFHRRSRE
jgi:cytochrome P450